MSAPNQIKPAISLEHQWHGVLTNDYGAEIEAFGDLGVDPDEDGTRWAYPPVQYTRTDLTDPAAIREAALREALEVTRRNGLESGDYIHERILALIGEKK